MNKMIKKILVASGLTAAPFCAMATETVTMEMIVNKINQDMPRALSAYCENVKGDPVFTSDPSEKELLPRYWTLEELHEICSDNDGVAGYELTNFGGIGALNFPNNQRWQLYTDAIIKFNNGHEMTVLVDYNGDSEVGLKPFKEQIIPLNQMRSQ